MFSMTRFSKLIKYLPKDKFQRIIEQTGSDKYSKTLSTWDIMMTMMYGQLTQAKSMRTLIEGYNSHSNHHYHLNSTQIKRSTLSDALNNRKVEPFKQLCERLLAQVSKQQANECKALITLIDSSPINLKGKGYEWTQQTKTNRTQGLKLHIALDSNSDTPVYANITHANVNDIIDAKTNINIEAGQTYVFDKGYVDYNWWYRIETAQAQFVSRIKSNTAYQVIEEKAVKEEDKAIIASDQTIHLTNKKPRAHAINHYAFKDLRLVTVYREDKTPMAVVTNDFERSAKQIAELYKQRWQIELFFKWIKQRLKLKSYFGRSENAARIQIYCALITYLLMKIMKNAVRAWDKVLSVQVWLQHGLFVRDDTVKSYYYRKKEQRAFIKKVQNELPLLC